MNNLHIETDIALLLMQIENTEGDTTDLVRQIREKFAELRSYGNDIAPEFIELEKLFNLKTAA